MTNLMPSSAEVDAVLPPVAGTVGNPALVDVPNLNALTDRLSNALPRASTPAQLIAAYEAGELVAYVGNEVDVIVPLSTTQLAAIDNDGSLSDTEKRSARLALVTAWWQWRRRCHSSTRIWLGWPDGVTNLGEGTAFTVYGDDPDFCHCSATEYDSLSELEYTISSFASVQKSGQSDALRRTVTVGTSTALASRIVDGMGFGVQNPQGNNDARAFAGAGIVEDIAAGRQTIDYDSYFGRVPTDPTTIDTTTAVHSTTPSRLIFPYASVAYGGNATAPNALFHIRQGGRIIARDIALVALGTASFGFVVANEGGDLIDDRNVVYAGAAKSALVNVSASGRHHGTSSFYGGGGNQASTSTCFVLQTGAHQQLVLCSMGGMENGVVQASGGASWDYNRCFSAGGDNANQQALDKHTRGSNKSVDIYGAVRGVYPINGAVIEGDGNSNIRACVTAVTFIAGNVLWLGGLEGNSNDASSDPGLYNNGGYWLSDASQFPRDGGLTTTCPQGDARQIKVRGKGGRIIVSALRDNFTESFEIDVDAIAAGTTFRLVRGDSGVSAVGTDGSVDLTTADFSAVSGATDGNLLCTVSEDGSDYWFQIASYNAGTLEVSATFINQLSADGAWST